MMKRSLFLITAILLFYSTTFAEEKMRVAILDLKADGIPGRIARTVSDMIRTEFVKMRSFTVVERAQMDAIMTEQGLQMAGCTDQECAVKVGRLMSARKILIGTVSPLGKAIVLNVRIVDVEKGVSEYAAKEKAENEDRLDRAVDTIAMKIAKSIEEGGDRAWRFPVLGKKLSNNGVSLSGSYLMPAGDFGDLLNPGYGVLASFFIRDIFIENLSGGIEGGYYLFSGNEEKVDSAYIIPVSLTVSYSIPLWRITFLPRISAGYSYISIKYAESALMLFNEEYSEKASLDPMTRGGLLIALRFGRFGILAGAEYGAIFEKDGQLSFLTFLAGLEARFGI